MSMTSSKSSNISHFLGVDFGKSKIGLAVADSETRIAFSFGMLKNDKELIENLKNIIEKKGIEKIIIGSTNLSLRGAQRRSNPEQCKNSRDCFATLAMTGYKEFGELLSKKLNISIEYQNEVYSTQQAERNLKEKGAKKIKRFDDQEAARIILQSWLDKKE
jgi:putative holliday junction resolvase